MGVVGFWSAAVPAPKNIKPAYSVFGDAGTAQCVEQKSRVRRSYIPSQELKDGMTHDVRPYRR